MTNILQNVAVLSIKGDSSGSISAITFDSRKVIQDCMFVAQKGLAFDGHQFIDKAIESGANCIVCEDFPKKINKDITYIKVSNSQSALAEIASNFYDNPSEKLTLIGITGTNGKTTIATLLYQLYTKAGYLSGLLSTIKICIGHRAIDTTHTTPDSLKINKVLADMVAAGVSHCFMEVSSHGIDQRRTQGLSFGGGVFTNLSHDHLDYHKDFAEYRDVKKSFFDTLPKSAFALVNIDDKNGAVMLQNTKAKKVSYALRTLADFKAKILENQFSGLLLNIANSEVWTKLIGSFNAYNLLAVFGVTQLLEMDKNEALVYLSGLQSVDGRFQYFSAKEGKTVIVDYAHTPDALQNVLETIRDIRKNEQEIITVVGCGGNRDKAKRPIMGRIASQLSNQVIFTSDNPRNEDPNAIINEMESGLNTKQKQEVLSIVDREQAIRTAVKLATPNAIILIAGKGHENYQEIKGERSYFNDYEVVTNIFKAVEN